MFERSKNDIELLQASRGGNPRAFGILVDRYKSLVCAITYSATGSVERSEELAQEAFLRAWKGLGQLQDFGKFGAWLCRIARSTVQNWFRSREHDVMGKAVPLDCAADKTSDESGPEEAVMIQEQHAVVSQALNEIPEALREPLILYYREDKSIQEVAQQFGLSENAARQRISRGRSLLRKQVAHMVETTLARSRPGKAFTAAVIACLAATAVKSSAAVAAVGAVQAASAAGKSVGLASLLSGTTAKVAAVAAGLALVTGGIIAYRQLARAAEPVATPASATAAVSQTPVAEDRPEAPATPRGIEPDTTPAAQSDNGAVAVASLAAATGVASTARERAKQEPKAPTPDEFKPRGALSGLITDAQTGKPVQDALARVSLRRIYHARTDADGFYCFESIPEAGNYRVTVDSREYVGVSENDRSQMLPLSPEKQAVQHFQLPPACMLDVQVADANGVGIQDAIVTATSLAEQHGRAIGLFSEYRSTDPNGCVRLGGLPPSPAEYLVTVRHQIQGGTVQRGGMSVPQYVNDYAPARAVVRLTDPNVVPQVRIVLPRGREVQGLVQYADGMPVTGIEISATPIWWHSTSTLPTAQVGRDGTFTLQQIVPGAYDIAINTPSGELSSTRKSVMQVQLPVANGEPLVVRLTESSPQASVAIRGSLVFRGEKKPSYVTITAYSSTGKYTRAEVKRTAAGEVEDTFAVEGLEPGSHRLHFSGENCEQVMLPNVPAPTSDLKVELVYAPRPKLSGAVVAAQTGAPVKGFQVRVRKLRSLRGSGYVVSNRWTRVADEQGKFSVDTVGPGVYQVQAWADGYAPTWSEEINTDQNRPTFIALPAGGAITGRVVDAKGRPVDKAKVIPLSLAGGVMLRTRDMFTSADGAAETTAGNFTLSHLPGGTETLKITHPDHAFALVEGLQVLEGKTTGGVVVALDVGGTVEGYVYDERGKPMVGQAMYFQDDIGYMGGGDEEAGRLAQALTDANGFYRVAHLPQRIYYVKRANDWTGLGVVRLAVLARNDQVTRLDFGGTPLVTGIAVVDGKPVAGARLALGSVESSHSAAFTCRAMTDAHGGFVFTGVPPGTYGIFREQGGTTFEVLRLATIKVAGTNVDVGVVPRAASRLLVRIDNAGPGMPQRIERVELRDGGSIYAPLLHLATMPSNAAEPWIVTNVAAGRYALHATRKDGLRWQKEIELEPGRDSWEVLLDTSRANAKLSGHLRADPLHGFALWREARDVWGLVSPGPDGSFSVTNLPAGRYFVGEYGSLLHHWPRAGEFLLNEGESKVLDVNLPGSSEKTGALIVRVADEFGRMPDGARLRLQGPGGTFDSACTFELGAYLVVPPGEYTARAEAPGYRPLDKKVTVKPFDQEAGRPPSMTLWLEPR